jgi:hypothetical protein
MMTKSPRRRLAAMAAGLLLPLVSPMTVSAAEGPLTEEEIAGFTLTMTAVEAVFAAQAAIIDAAAGNPALTAWIEPEDEGDGMSISPLMKAERLGDMPEVAAALKEAGISARDFALVQNVLVQAGLALALGVTPEGVNPANVEWLRVNADALEELAMTYSDAEEWDEEFEDEGSGDEEWLDDGEDEGR